ncbi:MAG: transcription initiation factor IIB [Candidatus Lokiarchaeota archaeon]|nr:transcription initiation factor IIB [Candidatus Lokiarchaeota archaeon]
MVETKSKTKKDMIKDEVSYLSQCPECKSDLVIYDSKRGENICGNCGLVIDHHIPDTKRGDRRAFTAEEKRKRERTGSPISVLLPDMGLSTVIDSKAKMSQRMRRVIKWNSRMTWNKRNLLIATTEIKRIGSNLNLPLRVKELAAKIYRKAFAKKLLRGRSIKAMVAASLYFACRKEKVPRTLKELVSETTSDPRDIRRCYRILIKELSLRVPAMDPAMLIPKYATELGLSLIVEKAATEILTKFRKYITVSGKDPKGLVAAALYLASQELNQPKSQSKIAKTIGVTEVTLRSRYKEFKKLLKKMK